MKILKDEDEWSPIIHFLKELQSQASVAGVSVEQVRELAHDMLFSSNVTNEWKRKVDANLHSNKLSAGNIIETKNPNVVFTKMTSPYYSELDYEYFIFEPVEDKYDLEKSHPALAMPVVLKSYSLRLEPSRFVALFPENWAVELRPPMDTMHAYYFINRFFDRFTRFTKPLLGIEQHREIFSNVLKASDKELWDAAVIWLRLHEYFHLKGALPLPEFLSYKNSKDSAPFEELRADLNVLCEISKINSIPEKQKRITQEYLLGERLFHFASNYHPDKDSDSVASQILLNSLCQQSVIVVKEGFLKFAKDPWRTIERLKDDVNSIETDLVGKSEFECRRAFAQYTRGLGNYDPGSKKFFRLDIYENFSKLLHGSYRKRQFDLFK